MPQAVAFAAAALTAVITGSTIAATSAAVAAGTASLLTLAIYTAVEVGIYTALSLALNAAFTPKIPGQQVHTPQKQAIPPRRSGYGRARLSGFYMLFESRDVSGATIGGDVEKGGGASFDVLALHDGQIDGIEQYFLHDDVVTLGAGGRVQRIGDKYASRLYIDTRLGAASETVYARSNHWMPDLWPATSRGDGVASLELVCFQSKPANQSKDYPNGLPQPGVSARLLRVFDPRDEAQDQADPATWVWSENPMLHLLDYLTSTPHGMGFDYATYILPEVAAWRQAADDCDALVAISDSESEPAYRCGGVFEHTTAPSEVIAQLLGTCDGWLAQRGNGALTVLAGKYYAPTVTLSDRYVLAYTVRHFLPDEEVVNEIRPTFTSEANKFVENDAGAWRDEADISRRGKVQSQSMALPWCPSATQALRLAKRQLARQTTELRGSVTTNLYGLNALGERYLTLDIADNAALIGLVVEVAKIQVDLTNLTVTINWVAASPTVDAWTPDDQEAANGQIPPPPEVSSPPELEPPVITSVTPIYQAAASSDTGARLDLVVAAAVNATAEWLVRWRVQGTSNWHEASYADIDDEVTVELITGFVTANATLEVEVAYRTAGRMSPWSATSTVVVAAPSTVFDDAVEAVVDAMDQPFGFAFERDLSAIVVGKPVRYFDSPVAWTLPAGLADCQGTIGDSTSTPAAAPSAQTDFDLQVAGISVGTMRFAASALTATFIKAADTSVALGAVTAIVAPANLHGMAGTLFGSIKGTR